MNLLNCSKWYNDNFINIRDPEKLCNDYWVIANRNTTFNEALTDRPMRWALYSVYVIQRSRKSRFIEIEKVLSDFKFPKRLYASYMKILLTSKRINIFEFSDAISNIDENLEEIQNLDVGQYPEEFKDVVVN
jgi:hypothetical protein